MNKKQQSHIETLDGRAVTRRKARVLGEGVQQNGAVPLQCNTGHTTVQVILDPDRMGEQKEAG